MGDVTKEHREEPDVEGSAAKMSALQLATTVVGAWSFLPTEADAWEMLASPGLAG